MLMTAAILCFAIGLAHSVLGERYILMRLFRHDNLPKLFGDDRFTRRTLRFAWHLTSVAWWGFAAMLLAADMPTVDFRQAFLLLVTVVFASSGIMTLAGSRGRHPAWIVFLVIAGLALLAD